VIATGNRTGVTNISTSDEVLTTAAASSWSYSNFGLREISGAEVRLVFDAPQHQKFICILSPKLLLVILLRLNNDSLFIFNLQTKRKKYSKIFGCS
jgi:hypothetical protein